MKSIFVAVLAGLLLLSGCNVPKVTTVEGQERDAVLTYAEPMADALFQAMNAGDFAAFSEDLSPEMAKAMPEKAFTDMVGMLSTKIGAYQSREVEAVQRVEEYVVVVYKAKYDKDDPVTVRLTFSEGDAPQISGLWFDSAKLREK